MKLQAINETVSRRDFLKSVAATLVSSGLNPATVQNIVTSSVSATAPLYRVTIYTASSGRYMPDVGDSMRAVLSSYNILKSAGVENVFAGNHNGDAYQFVADVTAEQLAKLVKFGDNMRDHTERYECGLYIDFDINGLGIDVASSDCDEYNPNTDYLTEVDPSNLLKQWWNEWEKYGTETIDPDVQKYLEERGIDTNDRPNGIIDEFDDDEFDDDEFDEDDENDGEDEIRPRPDDEIYGSPMHQPYESKIIISMINEAIYDADNVGLVTK